MSIKWTAKYNSSSSIYRCLYYTESSKRWLYHSRLNINSPGTYNGTITTISSGGCSEETRTIEITVTQPTITGGGTTGAGNTNNTTTNNNTTVTANANIYKMALVNVLMHLLEILPLLMV